MPSDPDRDLRSDLEIVAAAEAELRAVEGVLQRLDEGGYGRCVACGQEIDAAVLAEDPLTSVCGRCRPPAPPPEAGGTPEAAEPDARRAEDSAAGPGDG